MRYWPLSILAWTGFTICLVAVALVSLFRARLGSFQHWPYWVGGLLLVIGSGLVAGWSNRPHFLTAPAPDDVASVEQFEAHITDLIASGGTPGVSVAVVKDGEVVYEQGFGTADWNGEPATVDTVYHWWSVTKVFTAVAVMQLVETGELELDAAVVDHLDEDFGLDQLGPGAETITIRQLLNHSSGMGDAGLEILGWIHFDGDESLDQTDLAREKTAGLGSLEIAPALEGRYSNIGYMVLGAVIEHVSSTSYEDYVTDNVLRPLGMSRTGFVYANDMGTEANGSHPVDAMTVAASLVIDMDRAVATRADGRDWFRRVYPDQIPPSGLIGSPADMTRFMAALLNGGSLDDVEILSPSSVAQMNLRSIEVTRSPAPVEGLGFGLAWFHDESDGRVSLTHGGQGTGTASMMRLYPEEGLGIVIVSNSTYLGKRFGVDEVEALANLEW